MSIYVGTSAQYTGIPNEPWMSSCWWSLMVTFHTTCTHFHNRYIRLNASNTPQTNKTCTSYTVSLECMFTIAILHAWVCLCVYCCGIFTYEGKLSRVSCVSHRSLMDMASVSLARGCGFESHRWCLHISFSLPCLLCTVYDVIASSICFVQFLFKLKVPTVSFVHFA